MRFRSLWVFLTWYISSRPPSTEIVLGVFSHFGMMVSAVLHPDDSEISGFKRLFIGALYTAAPIQIDVYASVSPCISSLY